MSRAEDLPEKWFLTIGEIENGEGMTEPLSPGRAPRSLDSLAEAGARADPPADQIVGFEYSGVPSTAVAAIVEAADKCIAIATGARSAAPDAADAVVPDPAAIGPGAIPTGPDDSDADLVADPDAEPGADRGAGPGAVPAATKKRPGRRCVHGVLFPSCGGKKSEPWDCPMSASCAMHAPIAVKINSTKCRACFAEVLAAQVSPRALRQTRALLRRPLIRVPLPCPALQFFPTSGALPTCYSLLGRCGHRDRYTLSSLCYAPHAPPSTPQSEYREARFMDDDDAGMGPEQLLLHAKQHKRERASVAKIRTGIRMLEEGLSGSKSELFSGNDQAKLQGHLASALRNLG